MARRTKEEARKAGAENPYIGTIGGFHRLGNVLGGLGEEITNADMATPFGQRLAQRWQRGEEELRNLRELAAQYPEEFGQGRMVQDYRNDPYYLNQVAPGLAAMRPGVTTFSRLEGAPVREVPAGPAMVEGAAPVRALPAPPPAPVSPYYRNVPVEMGTSARPMSAFEQNVYGMTTNRYGPMGAQYAPEMAVTDFESYAPGGMGRTTSGPTPISKFDQNTLDAYRRGRMSTGASRGMYGEYTPEEMGSAVVPYRQGGLVYEPVGGQRQAAGRLGGPQGRPGIGYERGPIEGEWSEVYGLRGPAGAPGMSMGDRMAAGAYGYAPSAARPGMPWGTMAGIGAAGAAIPLVAEYNSRLANNPLQPSGDAAAALHPTFHGQMGPVELPIERRVVQLPPQDVGLGRRATEAGAAGPKGKAQGKAVGAGQKGVPLPPTRPKEYTADQFEPNLNFNFTAALDALFGQGEAQRGRETQQYYATNPWPY